MQFVFIIVCRNTSPLLPRFVTCPVLFTSKESLSPSAYSLLLVQNLKVWWLMIGFLFSGLSFHGYVGESHGLVCKSLPHSGAQEKEVRCIVNRLIKPQCCRPATAAVYLIKIVSIFPRFFEVISSLRSWQFRFLLAQWKKRGRSAKGYFFLDAGRMSYSDRSKATTYSVFCVQSQKEVLHPENFYIDCHNAHFVD